MVKIQTRTIRKKNNAGKPPYIYKQHLIPVPLTRNEELKPFLKKQLEFGMNAKDDNLDVSLKKQEDLTDKHEKT